MLHPRIHVTANGEKDGDYTKHDRNVSWTVAFIRFAEPASSYAGKRDLKTTLKTLIVENDCVSVNINNSKASFAKTCQLTMKVSNAWYASNVNPGDWVFVWLNDSQDKNNELQAKLGADNFSTQTIYNGFDSGLKFVGRVLNLGAVDTMAASGTRTLTQTVSCQSFLELATSIYYTYISASVINPNLATPTPDANQTNIDKIAKTAAVQTSLSAANYLKDFSDKFISLYSDGNASWSPDSVIGYLFALTMGVDRAKNPTNAFLTNGITGTFNDSITIPKTVDNLLGRRGASRLCQIYQVILGIQKYKNTTDSNMGRRLSPQLSATQTIHDVILQTPDRCKGFVPFYPPSWDNTPIWSILGQYLNPVVNEMYTVLRMNSLGVIMPTVVVRETPFSTGLYNSLNTRQLSNGDIDSLPATIKSKFKPAATDKDVPKSSVDFKTAAGELDPHGFGPQSRQRTMFGELPRWVIDESMIQSVQTTTSESRRTNFVQVWGRSAGAEYAGIAQGAAEGLKIAQMNAGNYFADIADIQRHGLRAYITESQFDVTTGKGGSESPEWAKLRADWMFNGHLKLEGTISCIGIQQPICEGDNVEVRGIVYHIEAVNHSASIDSSGKKYFTTSLQVSNGMLADGLDGKNPPKYMCHLPKTRLGNIAPGTTQVQKRASDEKRTDDGEDSSDQ